MPARTRPTIRLREVRTLLAAERVGNQFMAQGRYQAALEVYSGVPPPTAKLWTRMGVAYQFLSALMVPFTAIGRLSSSSQITLET